MTRLTEEMVIARSKQSDLGSIKKLNCWGSDLSDVTIIKRMRGVEVLALSVNKITTLQPFEDCLKLQELYLRKNNITDINEVAYLQNLPTLKYLWLEENPCCDRVGANYRAIVLRALPNLKKLDNVEVTQEEIDNALRGVNAATGAAGDDDAYEDAYEQQQPAAAGASSPPHQQYDQQQQQRQHQQHQQYLAQQRSSSSPQKEKQMATTISNRVNSENSEETPKEPAAKHSSNPASPSQQRSPVLDLESPHAGSSNNGGIGGHCERAPIPPSISSHSMKEYYQSDRPTHYPAHYRHSQTDLTEWEEHQHQSQNPYGSTATLHHAHPPTRRSAGAERPDERFSYRNGSARENGDWDDVERSRPRRAEGRFNDSASSVSTAVLNHYTGYHRRPINRSSNLLSATLCLVKELDYPSLEVVEHAVRCRIDELSAE